MFIKGLLTLFLLGLSAVAAQTQVVPELKTLIAGQTIEREIAGGESHAYQITLTAGQFLHAQVEQQGIDLAIDLFDPGGQKLADADSPNDNWGAEPILLVVGLSGNYRVDIRSPNKTALTGRYEIKIIALREATVTDKTHVAAERAFNEGRKLRAQQTMNELGSEFELHPNQIGIWKTGAGGCQDGV